MQMMIAVLQEESGGVRIDNNDNNKHNNIDIALGRMDDPTDNNNIDVS
jgi:hypothetical protein